MALQAIRISSDTNLAFATIAAGSLPGTRNGPFSNSNSLYVVCYTRTAIPGNFSIGVFKSTDQGFTWSPMDNTHGPLVSGGLTISLVDVWLSGTTIKFCYLAGSAQKAVTLGSFNMATDLFGTVITGGPTAGANTVVSSLRAAQLSTGDVIFVYAYQNLTTGHGDVDWAKYSYSGAAWSNIDTVFSTNFTALIASVSSTVADSSDRVHVVYSSTAPGPINTTVFYRFWTSPSTLSSAQTILSSITDPPRFGPGVYVSSGDLVVFPHLLSPTSTAARANIFSGTPSSGPTMASTAVSGAPPANQSFAQCNPAYVDGSGTPYLFWGQFRVSGASSPTLVLYSTSTAGVWSAPVTYYSFDAALPSSQKPYSQSAMTALTVNLFAVGPTFGVIFEQLGALHTVSFAAAGLLAPLASESARNYVLS